MYVAELALKVTVASKNATLPPKALFFPVRYIAANTWQGLFDKLESYYNRTKGLVKIDTNFEKVYREKVVPLETAYGKDRIDYFPDITVRIHTGEADPFLESDAMIILLHGNVVFYYLGVPFLENMKAAMVLQEEVISKHNGQIFKAPSLFVKPEAPADVN